MKKKYKIEKCYNHYHDNYTYQLYVKTLFGWREVEKTSSITTMIKRLEDILENPICEGNVNQVLLFMKNKEKKNGCGEGERTTR
jgi:hypothetical protein